MQSDTPSPELLKAVRAELVRRGTSLNAECKAYGLSRQAVTAALSGARLGPKSRAIAADFLRRVDALKAPAK
jgi:lambda repressor-like predicted transcriptional regulator